MTHRVLFLGAALALAAARPAAAQGFGSAIAVAGPDVLIGLPGPARMPGAVVVYRKAPNGSWTERARLTPAGANPGDRFGQWIAADGDVLAAAAPAADSGVGALYVMRRSRTGAWTEAQRLAAEGGRRTDQFGRAIAVSGDWIAVSAPARDSAKGTVWLFRRSGDRYAAAGTLTANEPMANERFGTSLSFRGGRLVIGAPGRDHSIGAAYAYRWDDAAGSWRLESRITVAGLQANTGFGGSVTQNDSTIVVGAAGADSGTGAVYAFKRDSTGEWTSPTALRPYVRVRNTRFGGAVAFDGNDLLVGAPGADENRGAVYRVQRDASGAWSGMTLAKSASADRNEFLGNALASAGGMAVAGLPGDDNGAGSALVIERDRTGAVRVGTPFYPEIAGMDAVLGSERACAGGRAAGFDCNSVDLAAFLPLRAIGARRGVNLSSLWGWTDTVAHREWAIVGRNDATAFVDITDPSRPYYAGELPLTEGARPSSWREMKVYKDHAFIVSDGSGPHGMQVFDLTQLRGLTGPPRRFTPTTTYRQVASVHDIALNEETGYAYLTGTNGGGNTCGGGLHMVDVRNPTNPTFAGCFSDPQTGYAHTGYSHDALCIVYRGPDDRYRNKEICFGSNETALSIADVTDKARPVALSHASYPNVAYAHQAWITDDHRYLYMDDELDELQGKVNGTRTLIWDISRLDDPVLASEYISRNRATDHNLYIVGNTMYQANYVSGLRVLDISNRTQPREVGFFDTVPWGEDAPGFDGAWQNYPFFRSGTVIVSSIGQGLFVLKPRITRPVQ